MLQRDLVHAHGVQVVVQLRLRVASAKDVAELAGEVADLTDVDGDIRVVWARGDGEGMPLVVGDGWAVEEEPLAGLVAHAGLGELDLDGVWQYVLV